MPPKLATCFLFVKDPGEALAFYRDLLGLELRQDVRRGGFCWLTVGSPAQPEVGIVLTNYFGGNAADAETIAALLARGALPGVHLQAEDLADVFGRVQAGGAQIVQEPTDQPWGVRDFALRDPAGNLVRIEARPSGSGHTPPD